MPLEQFKLEGWYCVLCDTTPAESTIDPQMAELIRRRVLEYHKTQYLYYDRAKGFAIDRRKDTNFAMRKDGASADERQTEQQLETKEKEWQVTPCHTLVQELLNSNGGPTLRTNKKRSLGESENESSSDDNDDIGSTPQTKPQQAEKKKQTNRKRRISTGTYLNSSNCPNTYQLSLFFTSSMITKPT